ncbi:hypothetical protein ACHDRG_003154 [Clostridioides difficile]|nr:hypothetical protein [Clostridioides difficile]
MKKCLYCNRDIKSPNNKLAIKYDDNMNIYPCRAECKEKIEEYIAKKPTYKFINILEVLLGVGGIFCFLSKWTIAAQVVLGIDALVIFLFPLAGFKMNGKLSMEQTKNQSRSIAISILAFIVIIIVLYFKQVGK